MVNDEYTETEEKIFLAALEEFGINGKQGARMQAIADRAGFNKALVHYYFRKKDNLYDKAFDFVIRRFFFRILDSLDTDKSFPELMYDVISLYMDILESNPSLRKFLLREVSDGAPVLSESLRRAFTPDIPTVPEMFIRKFNDAVHRGVFRPLDPIQTLITLLGACVFFFVGFPVLSSFLPDLTKHRERMLAERKQHIYDILLHGLQPAPETKS